MAAPDLVGLAAGLEALEGVGADRLEHREARLAIGLFLLAEQVVVDQGREAVRGRRRRRRPRRPRACSRRRRRRGARRGSARPGRAGRSSSRSSRAASAGAPGRSRGPPARRSRRCSSRASSACGESSLARAAASSIASGRPSRRTQISATAGRVRVVTAKSALTARARSTKSATASYCDSDVNSGRRAGSGRPSGGTGNSCSPERWSGMRLVTSSFSLRRGGEQLGDVGRRLDDVLEVVEHEQEALLGEEALEALGERTRRLTLSSPSVCAIVGTTSSGRRSARARRRRRPAGSPRRARRQPGAPRRVLPAAARPGERQQAHVVAPEPLDDRGELALAPDQRRGLDGQVRRPVLERAQGGKLVRQAVDHELREPLRASSGP